MEVIVKIAGICFFHIQRKRLKLEHKKNEESKNECYRNYQDNADWI